ncbi:MAG: hypothetical protein MUF48_01835 [Pirellulaceae bacterium]|nr:hypothetical protein [Pirellulaceae bacterium]
MVRFSTGPATRTSRSARRPPPNYFSRRVQFQVGFRVFLFMTVLMLMVEARKPENWEWMWKLERHNPTQGRDSVPPSEGPTNGPASGGAAIDTRATEEVAEAASPPSQPLVSAAASPPPLDWRQTSGDRSVDVAVLHGWSSVWDRLPGPQRILLRDGLRRQRRGELASPHDADVWGRLLAELKRQWDAYQQDAAATLTRAPAALTPDQHREARAALAALEVRWRRELEALAAANESTPVAVEPAAVLESLQQVLDQRAWQAVEDNTVLRSADHEAWLRGWERVDALSPATASAAAQRVTFLQLFSQPDAYRGRLVQVSGTARHGYTAVSRDPHGLGHDYHVLWLRPSDGSNAPIVVYVREVPAGFPPLPVRGTGQDGVELREEVVVTGVFFKRWLYASRDGLRMAPLVLGHVTRWTRVEPAAATPTARPIGPWRATGLVLAAAALGCAGALLMTRSSRRLPRAAQRLAPAPTRLPEFASNDVQPAVGARLSQLAEEQRDET